MASFWEAFGFFFRSNLRGGEVIVLMISGLIVLIGFWKRPEKWIPYLIFWSVFPVYVTLIRRALGLVGESASHERLASDVLNVFMLVPFGIAAFMALKSGAFLSKKKFLLKKKESRIRRWLEDPGKWLILCTLSGMLLSACIEVTQILTGLGMGEIPDLITNTLGAFLGALGTKFAQMWIDNRKKART